MFVHPEHQDLLREFSKSVGLKYLLSEGEKLLMIALNLLGTTTTEQMAEYSLIGALVGLVARFLFQPAEEAAFNAFSVTVKDVESSWMLLRRWLSAMLAIGVSAIIFSHTCGRSFLLVAYTDKWASESAEALLKAYCLYCFCMAMNGTTEGFAFARGN